MDEKEIEKIIENTGEKVAIKDFEEIWPELEARMEQETVKRKKRKRLISSLISCAACLVIACSVSIPLFLNNNQNVASNPSDTVIEDAGQEGKDPEKDETVYYFNDLTPSLVDKTEFYEKLENSGVGVVDLTRFEGEYKLLITETGLVKGGGLNYIETIGLYSYSSIMQFTSADVKTDDEVAAYSKNYSKNGVSAQYLLKSTEGNINNFIVKASFNSVNYTMKIKTDANDLTEFFDEFFVL